MFFGEIVYFIDINHIFLKCVLKLLIFIVGFVVNVGRKLKQIIVVSKLF